MKPIRVYSLFFVATLALLGCQAPSSRSSPLPSGMPENAASPAAHAPSRLSEEIAARAEAAGEYVVAAGEYAALAAAAPPPLKQHYQLKAAETLLKAGQLREARDQAKAIEVSDLDPIFLARRQLLEGRIAAAEGDHRQALALFTRAHHARLSPQLLAQLHNGRAQARAALGDWAGAARDLLARERYLVDERQITDNQRQLWQILGQASYAQLKQERQKAQEPVLTGWLDLAMLALERSGDRFAFAVQDWRARHPTHPATRAFLAQLGSPQRDLVGSIDRLALLLPLTSDHGQAADAVRRGFLAMHEMDKRGRKPAVRVYDTGNDLGRIGESYQRAVREGAQLVVGPLGLEATDRLAQTTELTVPTLLLSHTDTPLSATRAVLQFGLPPEQEARQAAERAYLDGRRRVAILYPESAWGERVFDAFVQHFQRLGGVVVTRQPYALNQNDYSQPVERLLNVTESEARKRALETRLRLRLKMEPRRRQDIDSVFLAADARHGRLIKPQLNYHRASDLPVYATSHVFSGTPNPPADVDLDGVMFGDMPWMLVTKGEIARLRDSLQKDWPYAHTPLDRLFALGVDAYAVIPHLDRLNSESGARFNGVTSGLSIGLDGRLQRQLLWATFRRGTPRLLDGLFGYAQLQIDGAERDDAGARP